MESFIIGPGLATSALFWSQALAVSILIIGGASPAKFILSSSLSCCVLLSIGIKSSSIRFCKFLLSTGRKFFKILSERAFMSTSSVFSCGRGRLLLAGGGSIMSSIVTIKGFFDSSEMVGSSGNFSMLTDDGSSTSSIVTSSLSLAKLILSSSSLSCCVLSSIGIKSSSINF